jgi:hypothetical protein
MLVQLRQTIVCRTPPSAPALLVRMLTCASEGASGQGSGMQASTHTRGGLSAPRGALSLAGRAKCPLPRLPANCTCASGSAALSPARFQSGSARSSRPARTRADRDRQWRTTRALVHCGRASPILLNVDLENLHSGVSTCARGGTAVSQRRSLRMGARSAARRAAARRFETAASPTSCSSAVAAPHGAARLSARRRPAHSGRPQ